jgi:ATP-binding cassette subfamily B protein
MVGEGGANLSGGQAQRIAIARALLNNPEILVLDEPTSALDSTSEAYVLESLQQASRDRTVVMVTHKLSSVRWADRIVVLDGGRVAAEGSWDELVQGDAIFRRMCREQNLLP